MRVCLQWLNKAALANATRNPFGRRRNSAVQTIGYFHWFWVAFINFPLGRTARVTGLRLRCLIWRARRHRKSLVFRPPLDTARICTGIKRFVVVVPGSPFDVQSRSWRKTALDGLLTRALPSRTPKSIRHDRRRPRVDRASETVNRCTRHDAFRRNHGNPGSRSIVENTIFAPKIHRSADFGGPPRTWRFLFNPSAIARPQHVRSHSIDHPIHRQLFRTRSYRSVIPCGSPCFALTSTEMILSFGVRRWVYRRFSGKHPNPYSIGFPSGEMLYAATGK